MKSKLLYADELVNDLANTIKKSVSLNRYHGADYCEHDNVLTSRTNICVLYSDTDKTPVFKKFDYIDEAINYLKEEIAKHKEAA